MKFGVLAHLSAAGMFLVLSAQLVSSIGQTRVSRLLFVAVGATASWAGAGAAALAFPDRFGALADLLEFARSAAWLLFLIGVLAAGHSADGTASHRFRQRATILLAGIVAAAVVHFIPDLGGMAPDARWTQYLPPLSIAVGGLALVENLFRNTPEDQQWRFKFLYLGIGGLFAYDFFLYANAYLVGRLDGDFISARGLTTAILGPLVALSVVRNPDWSVSLGVSRRFVLHSATLIGAGGYLIVMAAVGYYLRNFGGSWGAALQIAFLFGAVVLLVVSLSSGSVRAHLKVYISRSFFEYKYDYRDEWLRFIQTISRSELDEMLERRVIRAVADLVDSPEGAIWSRDGNRLSLATVWNVSRWNLPRADVAVPVDSALIEYLAKTQHVLDVTEFRENPAAYPGLELPAWMVETSQAWLILPLIHLERLLGVLVLGKPRAPRTLNWEDYDLLRTVGRQAASYLAEQAAGRALHEARQFEEFNHRFAFVVHDIKNLASQLSLVLANAERHKANAEFQEDMLLTIRGSVDKMTRLLTQLHGRPASIEDSKSVELAAMLKLIAEEFRSAAVKVTLDLQRTELVVSADPDRLFAVVHQLVQNAVEAASSRVDLRLAGLDDEALVEVVDDGPGMSAEFVRNALFRPFRSTKTTGYGIGAYEARDYIRSIGGDLEVVSAPRKGTTMRVKLSLPSAMAARISEKHLAKGVG